MTTRKLKKIIVVYLQLSSFFPHCSPARKFKVTRVTCIFGQHNFSVGQCCFCIKILAFSLLLHLFISVSFGVWNEGLLCIRLSAKHLGLTVWAKTRSLSSVNMYIIQWQKASKRTLACWVSKERKQSLVGVNESEREHSLVVSMETNLRRSNHWMLTLIQI